MPKKFLIGQLACYGDCLYATTIARQIKHDHPDSHITWAVAAKYRSILEHNPDIDDIWEVAVPGNDFYQKGWTDFETAAREKKEKGEFDEIIFSQIHPLNWINYNGTIRGTILGTYNKQITVSKDPVVQLTPAEKDKVLQFAEKNKLQDFEHIILFECAPGSGQSKLTPEFALNIAKNIVEIYKNVCFILSSPVQLTFQHPQIIDGSVLSFRENAALTHYCNLLIGCSSGITWISTSTAAKKLPMIQLLNSGGNYFAGVHYDFEINQIDNSEVIELLLYDEQKVEALLKEYFSEDFSTVKSAYHQDYKPGFHYLLQIIRILIYQEKPLSDIRKMISVYRSSVGECSINYPKLYYLFLTNRSKVAALNMYRAAKNMYRKLPGNKHLLKQA